MTTILVSKPSTNSEYLRTYRFELIYPDLAGKWFTLNLISAEIPSLTFEQQRLWDGTVKTNYVNSVKYEAFRLEFYMNLISDPIYSWIQQHVTLADMRCPMNIALSTTREGIPTYKKNLILKLYDGKQRTVVEFMLLGCMLTNVQFTGLNYTQAGVMNAILTVLPDRVIYPQGTNLYPDMLTRVPGTQFLNRIQTNAGDLISNLVGLPPGVIDTALNLQGLIGGAFTMSNDTLNMLGLSGISSAYNSAVGKVNEFRDKVENQGKACQGGSESVIDSLSQAGNEAYNLYQAANASIKALDTIL